MGRRWNEIKPSNTTARKNITTATGRLVERLESDICPRYSGWAIGPPTCSSKFTSAIAKLYLALTKSRSAPSA